MEKRVQLQPAYLLHRMDFQNTSVLADFFCLDYGRVRAVAKGARTAKSKYRPLLQLFQPVLLSFTGRGEVKTVTGLETSLAAIHIKGERLFSALYVNELLTRLLHNHVEHTALYKTYQETLLGLQGAGDMQTLLRRFELDLLAELGYGVNLHEDCQSAEPIERDTHYRFTPDVGFERFELLTASGVAEPPTADPNSRMFLGEHLLAIRDLRLTEEACAKSAKRLLRLALAAHLGGKPLHSRNLFTNVS